MDVRRFVNGKLQADATCGQPPAKSQDDQDAPSLERVISSQAFVAISVGNCPQCEELAAFLAARGVPASVFVKWDRNASEYQELKSQLQAHAGDVFTFPQVFANGAYQGGFKEVIDKAERGVFDELFEKEFDAEPRSLKRQVERRSMVVFSLPNC